MDAHGEILMRWPAVYLEAGGLQDAGRAFVCSWQA